jgi:hypothetical protein
MRKGLIMENQTLSRRGLLKSTVAAAAAMAIANQSKAFGGKCIRFGVFKFQPVAL